MDLPTSPVTREGSGQPLALTLPNTMRCLWDQKLSHLFLPCTAARECGDSWAVGWGHRVPCYPSRIVSHSDYSCCCVSRHLPLAPSVPGVPVESGQGSRLNLAGGSVKSLLQGGHVQGQVEVSGGRAVSDKICAVARQILWQVIARLGYSSSRGWQRVKRWVRPSCLPVAWFVFDWNGTCHSPNLATGSRHLDFNSHSLHSVNHPSTPSHLPNIVSSPTE